MSVSGNLHGEFTSAVRSGASLISSWKLYVITCFLILLKLAYCVLLTGLLLMMLCNVAFDGVLGGVMGPLCSVVFQVLSSFVNFRWDGILGMTAWGSNSYFDFSR